MTTIDRLGLSVDETLPATATEILGDLLAIKTPVRVATTVNINLNGLQTIDGVSVAAGDRVLVKDQTLSANNGIYVVDTGGWSRAIDFDGDDEVVKGTLVFVNEGTTSTRETFAVTTEDPIIPGTSDFTFATTLAGNAFVLATDARFGALGDDATLNDTAIASAISYCVANAKTLAFPDGIYRHSGPLNWAYNRLKVIALGGNVVFKHTGSGIGHSFSGIANYPATQGCIGASFGAGNRIILKGNVATTHLVLIDNFHFGLINISCRDATNTLVKSRDTGIVASAAVCTILDIQISQNIDGVTFTTVPSIGCDFDHLNACQFRHLTVENCGVASRAVRFTTCIGNFIEGGTIESNAAGGVYLDPNCHRNTFTNVDVEVNGTQEDWYIEGKHNTFINCSGAGTMSGNQVLGDRNVFIGGQYQSMTITGTADGTWMKNCEYLVAFTNNGSNTTILNPDGFATAVENATTILGNKTINTANNITLKINSNTVNAVTGTGSTVVLATSPALVTPDLGTPSAAVLTNATGLPISSGVSGLATGVATFLATPSSANLAAALTNEDGTGVVPFEVSNTVWTPSDQSGAALTFTSVNCKYTKIGNIYHIYGALTYPATADGSAIVIGGLPATVPNQTYAGAASGVVKVLTGGLGAIYAEPQANATTFKLWSNGTPGYLVNSQLTSRVISFHFTFPAT